MVLFPADDSCDFPFLTFASLEDGRDDLIEGRFAQNTQNRFADRLETGAKQSPKGGIHVANDTLRIHDRDRFVHALQNRLQIHSLATQRFPGARLTRDFALQSAKAFGIVKSGDLDLSPFGSGTEQSLEALPIFARASPPTNLDARGSDRDQ
jgi:hypothetical protein